MVAQPSAHLHYGAYLQVQVGQEFTILGPLVWLWHDANLISGNYVAAAAIHVNRDHALVGLAPPRAAFLDLQIAPPVLL